MLHSHLVSDSSTPSQPSLCRGLVLWADQASAKALIEQAKVLLPLFLPYHSGMSCQRRPSRSFITEVQVCTDERPSYIRVGNESISMHYERFQDEFDMDNESRRGITDRQVFHSSTNIRTTKDIKVFLKEKAIAVKRAKGYLVRKGHCAIPCHPDPSEIDQVGLA